jgi:hypothetical protein
VNGLVFDAGGLIAIERDNRRVYSMFRAAVDDGDRIIIPATALAQVIRDATVQVRLSRMLRSKKIEVVSLDASSARAVGKLLARSRTSDITDAHVVICAQAEGYSIITSDPLDLKRLDPELPLITV